MGHDGAKIAVPVFERVSPWRQLQRHRRRAEQLVRKVNVGRCRRVDCKAIQAPCPARVLTGVFTTAATCSLTGTGGTGTGLDTRLRIEQWQVLVELPQRNRHPGTARVPRGGSAQSATGATDSGSLALPRTCDLKNHNPPGEKGNAGCDQWQFEVEAPGPDLRLRFDGLRMCSKPDFIDN